MCLTEQQDDQPPKDLSVFLHLYSLAYFCIYFRSVFRSGFGLSSSQFKRPYKKESLEGTGVSLRPTPTSRKGPTRLIPTLDPLPHQPHHPVAHI